jgi:uncharacterized protein (TIGR02598 family)
MKRIVTRPRDGFSLIEVVLAIGVSSFALLTAVGMLVVATDTQKRSADATYAVQIAANEFERIGAISDPALFPTQYPSRYFDATMAALPSRTPAAVYEFAVLGDPIPAAPGMANARLFNAEVRFPVGSVAPEVLRFTKVIPAPSP